MELCGYGLEIVGGNEKPDGYVEMVHGKQYSLHLINDNDMRCDVEVHIDGKHVGTWRIEEESYISIERPVNDTGKFTFYKFGTPEARQSELEKNEVLGLVTAIFKPEKVLINVDRCISHNDIINLEGKAAPNFRAGGTGLSDESEQRFGTIEALEYDLEKQVTIHLRLIAAKGQPRPLKPISTPIPPPVD